MSKAAHGHRRVQVERVQSASTAAVHVGKVTRAHRRRAHRSRTFVVQESTNFAFGPSPSMSGSRPCCCQVNHLNRSSPRSIPNTLRSMRGIEGHGKSWMGYVRPRTAVNAVTHSNLERTPWDTAITAHLGPLYHTPNARRSLRLTSPSVASHGQPLWPASTPSQPLIVRTLLDVHRNRSGCNGMASYARMLGMVRCDHRPVARRWRMYGGTRRLIAASSLVQATVLHMFWRRRLRETTAWAKGTSACLVSRALQVCQSRCSQNRDCHGRDHCPMPCSAVQNHEQKDGDKSTRAYPARASCG
ncbi:uncharacterized protein LAESUDRAFT_577971 [Laetiporus sulphureus 93-53]|uniref:Uncharacterized protein n=1 Tax=Laetiporus sulphureus 93-53 TaxID=1314785 RepID=A0A165B197_9APHY|nr:uncharacterized protein LAESUDRAFT_577971 [Laetiporus sulphureus 93-53]KZT00038.1 hypothetical protein LAESUDRAFT_577971 [Laetiporus sulphureus 93-53]